MGGDCFELYEQPQNEYDQTWLKCKQIDIHLQGERRHRLIWQGKTRVYKAK